MALELKVADPAIVLDERGVAYIGGTTAKVIELVRLREANGWTPEELQDALDHLTLAQVCAALAYYDQNQAQLDRQIEELDALVERMRLEAGEGQKAFERRLLEARNRR